MNSKTAKTDKKQKDHLWKKGKSGNPQGRPQGSRNKASLLAETLLENETEALVRKCIDMALAGESTSMRIVMERLLPVRKDRPVSLKLPKMKCSGDLVKAMAVISEGVSYGEITPSEGQILSDMIEVQRKAIETCELERRLADLEENAEKDKTKTNRRGR